METNLKFGLSRYTLDCFLEKIIKEYGPRPALSTIGDTPYSYTEFGRRVDALRESLIGLGLRKQDKIAFLGQSSPHWAIAFMAVTTMGAVAVPILEDFPENDIDHIIRHSEAKAVFISAHLFNNLNLSSLDNVRLVIRIEDYAVLSEKRLDTEAIWTQLHEFPGKIKRIFDKAGNQDANDAIVEGDLAEILYTSGTTGHSKGVMLTHGNLVSNLFEGPDLLKVIRSDSVVLSILPMAHAFGSTSAFLSIVYCGSHICYLNKPPSPKILLAAMQEVRPTIMGAVPLVFEKIFHKQVVPIIAKSLVSRLLMKTGPTKKMLYKLIGRKVMKMMGGRLECVIIGGASFSPEVETFMIEGGIPYCCGYGLSECSPLVTFSSMETRKMGSPGHAITDVTLKIMSPDPSSGIGEILVKGPNVMKGYYKNDEETENAFTDDGWFITGDRGYLDNDGYLFITGRSKNVIVGPSGENIYPESIEAKLIESIFVEETIVYSTDNQLVARIHPNYTYIESMKGARDENAIASDVTDILEKVRQETNALLPVYSKITKVIEQPSPFIKTPTNKIKRAEYVPGYLDNDKRSL